MKIKKEFLIEKKKLNESKLGLAAALGIAGSAMAAPPDVQMPQIDRILTGVGAAEHRGRVKGSVFDFDPSLYVRTGAPDKSAGGKPSSAYGPFQFTRSTIKDLSTRHPDLFSGSEGYVSSFLTQGKKMLENPNDPKYGYGGSGDLASEDMHQKYIDMSRAGLAAMAKDLKIDMSKPLSTEDESRLVQRFRGRPLEKDYATAYYKGVESIPAKSEETSKEEKPKTETETKSEQFHEVVEKETLGGIAQKYGKKLSDVVKANPELKNPDLIKPKQKIRIPG